ncbi:hypothetical protein AB4305_31540 [Nocardia sp. 2YAB30]|uniref:hypothetical protein n=1 Tax=unclassified Nocardia TaxID=2637762 RepID=UPI003F99A6F3
MDDTESDPQWNIPESRRHAAREVLRRLVEQRVGPGQTSWQLIADLGVRDISMLITNNALRERFVTTDHSTARAECRAEPAEVSDCDHARLFAHYLVSEPDLSVTQLINALPLIRKCVPVEWVCTRSGETD